MSAELASSPEARALLARGRRRGAGEEPARRADARPRRDGDGVPFIVMELLEGRDLAKHLIERGRLSSTRRRRTSSRRSPRRSTGRTSAGSSIATSSRSNIFLCDVGGRELFVKLLDFGIAKGGGPTFASRARTRTGAMMGTPYYMSPEQMMGSKLLDPRTDLWSLGVVVYQCVLGQRPFEAETFGALAVIDPLRCAPSADGRRSHDPPRVRRLVRQGVRAQPRRALRDGQGAGRCTARRGPRRAVGPARGRAASGPSGAREHGSEPSVDQRRDGLRLGTAARRVEVVGRRGVARRGGGRPGDDRGGSMAGEALARRDGAAAGGHGRRPAVARRAPRPSTAGRGTCPERVVGHGDDVARRRFRPTTSASRPRGFSEQEGRPGARPDTRLDEE